MKGLKHLATLILFLVCLFHNGQSFGKVYIDIDSPAFQRLPIAIADFKPLRSVVGKSDLPVWFAGALSRDLLLTGYFNVIDRQAFLEDLSQAGITEEGTRFGDWSTIGAEYLVKGGYQMDDRELVMEFRLFDVTKGALVVGKRYIGKPDDRSRIVRQFANEILLALTGETGLFDTQIAFVKKGQSAELYAINFDGSDLRRITHYNSLTLSPRWSPDGRRLAFTSFKDGNPDIYLQDLGSGKAEKLVSYPGLNLPGSWSRDGAKLLVTLSREGSPGIYDMNVGNKTLQRLTRESSINVSPVRSPDEKRIAFVSNRNGSPQIYIMDAEGGNVRRLTVEGNYNTSPAWSPKGKKIAYEGSVNGQFQIFVIDEEGGAPRQMTFERGDHESPSWSPDGRYLVYSVRGIGRSRIEIINAGGRNPRVLQEGSDACQSPFWSPRLR